MKKIIILISMIFVILIIVLYYLNIRYVEHIETADIKLNLNESNKITNHDLNPNKFNSVKYSLMMNQYLNQHNFEHSKKVTVFYFPGECPNPIDDIYIHDIQNDYYYLPEKNSVIVIIGDYSWTNGIEVKRPDFDSNLYDLIIDDNVAISFHRHQLNTEVIS